MATFSSSSSSFSFSKSVLLTFIPNSTSTSPPVIFFCFPSPFPTSISSSFSCCCYAFPPKPSSHSVLCQRNNRLAMRAHSSSLNNYSDADLHQARDALIHYLQQLGASQHDSLEIASNSPNYLRMLVDSVRDLDDWNSWASNSPISFHTFKDKVYQMADQKGDKGFLPLLESLGLSLSSATHLARYVSSSSYSPALPLLIQRVKYMKEILFSDSNADRGLIGKNARLMMMHLSISTDEDLQHTLSFFEKIQARRGGLNLLASRDTSFRHLIESFPRLLLLSIESHMIPIVEFLADLGLSGECTRNILLLYPPILFYDVDKDIKPRLQAFAKVGAQDKDFGKMLLKYPWILSTSVLENYENILKFFDEEKVPKVHFSRAIKRWPHILGCSINKLKLMVEQILEVGIKDKKLGHIISSSPQLLLQRPLEFLQVLTFLKDLGLDEEAIGKTLGRCPEIFAASIDKTLKKKLDFLYSIGVSKAHLPRVVRKYPEFFVCDVDRALLPRMKYLMKIGLSKREVGFMVRRFSPLLGYSIEEVLRPKLEFLMDTMGKPLSDVVEYPRYLSYSLEKKIKPRYWILKGRNIDCSLKEMLGKNDEEFAAEFMGIGRMLFPPS